MSELIINPELNWESFPANEADVLSRFNGYQTIVLAKIPKGIDEDFNQNGIYFGNISNADLDYSGMFFSTSYWNGQQDAYYFAEIFTESSPHLVNIEEDIYSIYSPITKRLRLEDITEFVVVERMKIQTS
ncbi:hypothetical protein [Psychrobacter namhaensis]|uniref:hypothetical protein n=1 Tax=Psychrobacter namhaensis TaxID=292734 RepID=UPI0018DFEC38|nr:hypothetical protein [Psychrobacter namhaensis]